MRRLLWEGYSNTASVFDRGHQLVVARSRCTPGDARACDVQYGGWHWKETAATTIGLAAISRAVIKRLPQA